jgi:hypothetical protein
MTHFLVWAPQRLQSFEPNVPSPLSEAHLFLTNAVRERFLQVMTGAMVLTHRQGKRES